MGLGEGVTDITFEEMVQLKRRDGAGGCRLIVGGMWLIGAAGGGRGSTVS